MLAVADIEIRKIGKNYHFKIDINGQTFDNSEEVKSVRRYHPYVVVQNNIVFRRHLSQSGLLWCCSPAMKSQPGFNGIKRS